MYAHNHQRPYYITHQEILDLYATARTGQANSNPQQAVRIAQIMGYLVSLAEHNPILARQALRGFYTRIIAHLATTQLHTGTYNNPEYELDMLAADHYVNLAVYLLSKIRAEHHVPLLKVLLLEDTVNCIVKAGLIDAQPIDNQRALLFWILNDPTAREYFLTQVEATSPDQPISYSMYLTDLLFFMNHSPARAEIAPLAAQIVVDNGNPQVVNLFRQTFPDLELPAKSNQQYPAANICKINFG